MIDRRTPGWGRIRAVEDGDLAGLHSVAQHIFGASLQLSNAVLPGLDGEAASGAALTIDELEAALHELRSLAVAQAAPGHVGTFGPTAPAAESG